jgi:hypothetical protein
MGFGSSSTSPLFPLHLDLAPNREAASQFRKATRYLKLGRVTDVCRRVRAGLAQDSLTHVVSEQQSRRQVRPTSS